MSKRTIFLAICLTSLLAMSGCGPKIQTDDPGPPPPHGGRLIPFADKSGVLEVVRKEGSEPMTGEVSFYFYLEGFTPFDPAPEAGIFVLANDQTISLESNGEGLATPQGPILFPDREVDGTLTVELDGEKRVIPLGVR